MSFDVQTTPVFEKAVKALSKKYRSLPHDLRDLISHLEQYPYEGIELTPGVHKLRMAITSKSRGKSGGARVITYAYGIDEENGIIYLLFIYDKSERASISIEEIKTLINQLGL